jgi:hypothetical protein
MRVAVWSYLVPKAGVLPGQDLGVLASARTARVFQFGSAGPPLLLRICSCASVHTAAESAGSAAIAE